MVIGDGDHGSEPDLDGVVGAWLYEEDEGDVDASPLRCSHQGYGVLTMSNELVTFDHEPLTCKGLE